MSIAFDRPLLIVLALLIIPCIIAFHKLHKSLFIIMLPLGPPGGIPFKAPANPAFIVKIVKAFEVLGVILLFIAAAGPHFSYTETLLTYRGADIIFVIDISPSMAALDMGGRSRFETARNLVHDFARRRPSDAFGLAALGQDAALLVPLTTDRESFFDRLDTLQIGELGDGTALGMGIGIAALHISRSTASRRVVVLITDGENNAGAVHPETAAAILGDLGVSFWVIGVGSSGEVPIDYIDPSTRARRTGTFDSRYDPEVLRSIAQRGNGNWIPAVSAAAFANAFANIDEAEITVRNTGFVQRKEPFHSLFLIMGFFMIIVIRVIRTNLLGAFL